MTARPGGGVRDPLRCQIELRHFWLWRTAVALVACIAIAAVLAWLGAGSEPRSAGTWAAGIAAVVGLFASGAALARIEPGTLRRERGAWSFVSSSSTGQAPEAGDLAVAIDLGAFMLLVLTRAGGGRRWLPAQRHGHESAWHGLRCAAHAPRPSAVVATAAGE